MEQANPSSAAAPDPSGTAVRDAQEPTARFGAGNLVVLSAATDGRAQAQGRDAELLMAEKWPGLLERVQGAARHIRDVEDRAQEQELHVQELLEQMRVDMDAARARVQAAEQQTRDVHAQATRMIQAAEERADAAEQMLQRIADTIEAEFAVRPGHEAGETPGARGRSSAA
ncbi:hypothetical protein MKK67_22505 [Methylobacterium sp. J-072]|uniref:hypothetical protein n=1 Tax=Methylobacterium sp. J-072 TaxID=2836651 RepID=UPI001FBB7B97|nr:hypothetical protein [Methylobacterium sp. J-072]MCJ2095254.1 hypothetical protein [Methylobacterium sp. J-072]